MFLFYKEKRFYRTGYEQYSETGIPRNAAGQQWVQHGQLTSSQSDTNSVSDRSKPHNGVVPINPLSYRYRVFRAPRDDGMVPVIRFSLKTKSLRTDKDPNEAGIVPLNQLSYNCSELWAVRAPKQAGMEPDKKVRDRSSETRFVNLPNEVGMVPLYKLS
jgi:hypothetical protein